MEDAMAAQHPDDVVELAHALLRQLVARVRNVDEDEVATDQPLGELGIDSLTAAEFSVEIEEQTGLDVPLEGFLSERTLTDVAHELARGMSATAKKVAEQ
jgi:acyl carrier protein